MNNFPSCDSFWYILFFPVGDDDQHHQLQMIKNKKLMAISFHAYWIMNHENKCNNFLKEGHLFQQYMAAKTESRRLSYIQMDQAAWRSTTYRSLTHWKMIFETLEDSSSFLQHLLVELWKKNQFHMQSGMI